MPLINLPQTELIIDVPDIQIGGVIYKRKISVIKLSYALENKRVATEGMMNFFDQNGNQIADSMLIRSYGVKMIADNDTYCDMQGTVLGTIAEAEADPSLIEGKDYMMQFDWFYMVASSQPIILNEMIKQFYLRAVASGRFN